MIPPLIDSAFVPQTFQRTNDTKADKLSSNRNAKIVFV